MVELAIILTVLIPIVLALAWPRALILVVLLTGTLPLTLGREGMMVTSFGRLDLYAIRLLGLWVAALLIIVPQAWQAGLYAFRFRWHLLFLLFAMAALLWAPSLVYGARMIAKLTAPFLFLLLVLLICQSWSSLRQLETMMLASGVLAVVISLTSVVIGHTTLSAQLGLGVPGLGPAATSANLAMLAMLALGLARATYRRSAFLLFGVFAVASFAGFTRMTIIALFVALTAILWTSFKGWSRWVLPLAGVVSLPALFLLSDTFRQRMFKDGAVISFDLITKDPASALEHIHGSGRFDAWAYVLTNFFWPSPVFGSGVGTTQHYFYTHATGLNVIHSEYIRVLAELGVFGALLLAVAAGAYMIRMVNHYRTATTQEGQAYALAALGSLVVYFLFMATDNAIDYVTSCGVFVFGIVGMSEKARELELQDSGVLPVGAEGIESADSGETGFSIEPEPARRFPLVSWK